MALDRSLTCSTDHITVSQMHAESESSPPAESAHRTHSSPPVATQYKPPPMDDPASKSEPVAHQEAHQAQHVQQTPKAPRHKRVNSNGTARPASAQGDRQDGSEENSEVESDDEGANPADQIRGFDWNHLHEEYHQAIDQCSHEEAELMGEWSSLMEVPSIYATSQAKGD